MQDRPGYVDEAELLALVRESWDGDVDVLDHEPVGFGAHHWRASAGGEARWFVTVDELGHPHTAASLESAYAGAAALRAAGLEFLHCPVVARSGDHTVPLPGRSDGLAVSLTPWLVDARQPVEQGAEAALLARLHAAQPVPAPQWSPRFSAAFADELVQRLERPWTEGPLGEQARALTARHLPQITQRLEEFVELAARTDPDTFVVTHGEPGTQNQLVTGGRVVLIDTETLMLAPAERDVARVWPVDHGWLDRYGGRPDPDLLRLFDHEWVLDEVAEFTGWLSGPHTGSPDDLVALEGLRDELERP